MAIDINKTHMHHSIFTGYKLFCTMLIYKDFAVYTLVTTKTNCTQLTIKNSNVFAVSTTDSAFWITENDTDVVRTH